MPAELCQVCGKQIPEHVKGRFCSRECFLASRGEAPPAPANPAPFPVQAQTTNPATTAPNGDASSGSAIGRGAYRKDPHIYLGVIEAERKRKIDFEHQVYEWGIRNAMGGVVYVNKNDVEIGDPIEETYEPAAPTPAYAPASAAGYPPGYWPPSTAITTVRILGGIWIGLGVLGLLSALGSAFDVTMMDRFIASENPDGVGSPIMKWVKLGVFILVLWSFFEIYTAVSFLYLKAWARKVLEIICWFNVGSAVLGTIGWIVAIIIPMFMKTPDGQGPSKLLIAVPLILGPLIMVLFLGVPFGAMLYFFRSEPVRLAASR